MIRTEMDSMPQELDELTRRSLQLEIEETALSKEKDDASKQRLAVLRKELAEVREKAKGLRLQWDKEKASVDRVRKLREELEATRLDMDKAERAYDLNKVAELRHGRIPQLEAELKKLEKAGKTTTLFKEEVSGEEIAEIVAKWTGVPVTRLLEGEKEKLLRLEDTLHKRVIGQDEAVTLVTEAILRARSGSRTRAGRSEASFSSGRRASARRSSLRRSRRPSSTPSPRSSASTCPSTWRSTRSRG